MGWLEVNIDVGFGGGEETQLFGPRNEKGSSLYQVDTLACVSPKGDVELHGCPQISSIANQGGVSLVVDNHVLVFDEGCISQKVNFSFASNVDSIAWVYDPNFLAVGQSSGVLSLAHLPSKKVILSQQLLNRGSINNQCFRKMVFCTREEGVFELEVLPSSGPMIKLSNIDFKSLDAGISAGDKDCVKRILDRMSREIIEVSIVHSESLHHIISYESQMQQRFLISGQGDVGLSVWEDEMDGKMSIIDLASDYFDEDIGFLKCLLSPKEDFFIALDSEHHISLWSTALLTPLVFYNDVEVKDFILFSTNAGEEENSKKYSSEEVKLVILTTPINKKSLLQVYSLPKFEHVYTLQVSGCSLLAAVDSQLDSIYFTEGVEDDINDDSIFEAENYNEELDVSTIRLRCLIEALPYSRFMRLLHKNKFDQAEEFAKQFDLDVEAVYSLKASSIINRFEPRSKLAPKTEEECLQAIMHLKDCLNNLTDASEVIHFCLNAALPTFHGTFDLLKYAKERVESKEVSWAQSSNIQSLIDGLNRLVTFEVAFGAKKFSATNWAAFLGASLLDEVMNSFESDVAAAIVIWRRHQPELEVGFTLDKLKRLLASIPDSIPSSKIIQWLREDFVPFVLTKVLEGQIVLARWLDARARHMEISEKENWPHNALELAEVIFKAFSDVAKSKYGRGNATPAQFAMQVCRLSIPCSAPDRIPPETDEESLAAAMTKLGDLVTCLREISILHDDFACKLSLHCYQQKITKTIAFQLLDRVLAPELIPGAVENYVRPYAAKHNLSADDLLLGYIYDSIEKKPRLVSSVWQSKLIAVVDCIMDKELKCAAATRIMKTASAPWSSDVKELANAMLSAYPQNEILRQLHKFAELKTTMLQYGIRDYDYDPLRGLGTIHYIFQCNAETALKDAQQVIETFQTEELAVYFFRVKTWIMNNKTEESCSFLRSLDVKFSIKTGERVIKWVISSLEDSPLDEEDQVLCTSILQAAIEVIRTLSLLDADFKRENQEHLSDFKNILSLLEEYDIFLSYDEYKDQQKKDEIWKNFIANYETKPDKNQKLRRAIRSFKAIRLADLLGFDKVSMQRQELAVCLNEGNTVDALRLLRDARMGIPSYDQLQLLKETLIQLLTEKWHSGIEDDLLQWLSYIDTVYRLAAFGASMCNEGELQDYLEVTKCLRLASLVSEQCETTDYRQDAFKQTDSFAKWTFTDQFEDDGMVLYSYEIIPLLRMYYKSCFRENYCKKVYESQMISGGYATDEALESIGERNKKIIQILMENNLHTIALQFILQVYGACLQNITCCNAGFPIPENFEAQLKSIQVIVSEMLQLADKATIDLIHGLYVKVLSHRQLDHDLALGYLCALPHKIGLQAMAALKDKFANKYHRIGVAALVGVDYAGLQANHELLKLCQDKQNAAYWGKKFVALKIPFDDVYKLASFDIQEKSDLLKLLVTNKNITISTLLKFCQTFAFEEDVALLAYIKALLLPQRGMKEDPAYKDKVLEAMSHVSSSEDLYKMLQAAFNLISPYDYERLSLVLGKIGALKPGSTSSVEPLLDQLFCYERCSPPSEYELSLSSLTEDEQLLRGSAQILPEISKVRLPFHPLIKEAPWKILSPELKSEVAARKLESVIKWLSLDTSTLYANTIHNIVSDRIQVIDKNRSGGKKAKTAVFRFDEVKGLLAKITNADLAVAVAQWVAKFLPVGEEKVKVLKSCVQLCKSSEKTCSEAQLPKARELCLRFSDLCKQIEVEALLCKHGISGEDYNNMTKQPEALIEKLYEDYGYRGEIVNGTLVGIPDIHNIAQEISRVSHTNLAKVHFKLLEKWLPSSKASGFVGGDTTLLDASLMIPEEDDAQEDEKNLKRVIYILNNSTQAKNAEYLLHFIFKESSSKVTNLCRIRAIQALFALVSVKVIEAYSQSESGLRDIRLHLTSLTYLAELESLHLPQSLSAFNRCNREGLVRGLWRNHSNEPKGVRLIADLCLDYHIYDVQLWNFLLPKLLAFGLVDYLRHILVALSGIPDLREIPCLVKMWRSVILAPFSLVSNPLSEDEEIACLEAANLLQRCPVILDLSMQDIANQYTRIGMYTQALLCLTLIPENAVRERCLEKLFGDVACFTILDKIEKERNRGRFEGHLDHVQEEIFSYIYKRKMYQDVIKSPYFQKFIAYLANSNQLSELIMETIVSGRLNNAVQLVQLHDTISSNSSSSGRMKASELNGLRRLMMYLQANDLFERAAEYFPDFHNENDPYSVQP